MNGAGRLPENWEKNSLMIVLCAAQKINGTETKKMDEIKPSGNENRTICGECRYLAKCAIERNVGYTTNGCEKYSRKRGRPATTVRNALGMCQPTMAPLIQRALATPAIITNDGTNAKIPTRNEHLVRSKQFNLTKERIIKLRSIRIPKSGLIQNILLDGNSGVGKNEIFADIFSDIQKPVIRINCGGDYKSSTLLGRTGIKTDGKLGWIHGLITECLINGYVCILDEGNCLGPDVTMPLHGLLDEGKITLPGNSETVIAHPDFEMHLTQNPLAYHGTKAQNQAFLDRFRVVRMDYDPEIDAALIQQLGVSENVQIAMNNFIQAVRKLFDSGLITQPFGHRTLDTIVLNHSVFSLSECVQMAFLNKLCDTDRLAIKRTWDDLVNCEGGNVDASK